MLKVKNDNIYITRGETSMLQYMAVRRNGEPYILAPRITDNSEKRKDYAVLAFTVKTGVFGKVVLVKYFDLESPPMYDGVTDYSEYGFHKFITQDIVEVSDVSSITDTDKVYHLSGTNSYLTRIKKFDGSYALKNYQFKLQLPFTWSDLEKLEACEYIYDIILYYGELTPAAEFNKIHDITSDEFPLEQNDTLVKIPLLDIHKFIVGASNNV